MSAHDELARIEALEENCYKHLSPGMRADAQADLAQEASKMRRALQALITEIKVHNHCQNECGKYILQAIERELGPFSEGES